MTERRKDDEQRIFYGIRMDISDFDIPGLLAGDHVEFADN